MLIFTGQCKNLGFIINIDSWLTDPEKIYAISSAPRPENVAQLISIPGMFNYYGRFIPHGSILLQSFTANAFFKVVPLEMILELGKGFV